MSEAFLDSSIVIGLNFRNEAERKRCLAVIPKATLLATSRYVIFEIARGFLRSILLLHNASFACRTWAEFHELAHSGQQRFKHYRMQTWLGAFDDYLSDLEREDGSLNQLGELAEFRAKLRTWARRGWKSTQKSCRIVNLLRCREDIKPPFVRSHDNHLHQLLPDKECGNPKVCGLDHYLATNARTLQTLFDALDRLSSNQRDPETNRRIAALQRLLGKNYGQPFDGSDCHCCGDALIAHEAPSGTTIVSKNRKHFEPICAALGKPFQG